MFVMWKGMIKRTVHFTEWGPCSMIVVVNAVTSCMKHMHNRLGNGFKPWKYAQICTQHSEFSSLFWTLHTYPQHHSKQSLDKWYNSLEYHHHMFYMKNDIIHRVHHEAIDSLNILLYMCDHLIMISGYMNYNFLYDQNKMYIFHRNCYIHSCFYYMVKHLEIYLQNINILIK